MKKTINLLQSCLEIIVKAQKSERSWFMRYERIWFETASIATNAFGMELPGKFSIRDKSVSVIVQPVIFLQIILECRNEVYTNIIFVCMNGMCICLSDFVKGFTSHHERNL